MPIRNVGVVVLPSVQQFELGVSLGLCLHLIRRDYGERVANIAARRIVMPPHRAGGQAQFVGRSVRARKAATLALLLDEIAAELDREHSVASMPARAAISERTFARRVRAETGTTPPLWLT
jgi:AraC family transcriptional regulator, transcriptional activator FtrA